MYLCHQDCITIFKSIFLKYIFKSSSHIPLFGCETTVPLIALVHRCSNSTIELKRHNHGASTIKLKRRSRSSAGAAVQSDDSCYLCLAFSTGIWPTLSISVRFGIGATIPVGQEIQCPLYAGFFTVNFSCRLCLGPYLCYCFKSFT